MPHDAASTPSAPPASEMRSVSERTWRASRVRLAPSARQTETIPLPGGRTRKKQTGEIGASEHQQHGDDPSIACTGLPYRSRNSGRPDDDGASVQRSESLGARCVRERLVAGEVLLKCHVQIGSGGLGRHARRETHHERPRFPETAVRLIRRVGSLTIDTTADLQSEELGRCDADDGVRHVVDRHRPAEDARVAAEPARPVRMTEDHDAVRRRAAFIARLDHAADDRPDSQHAEVVARDLLSDDRLGLAVDQGSASSMSGRPGRCPAIVWTCPFR